ncbi:MAG: bifunctional folylpolyglutamate synthase/dihydrofolate synthase [Longimicrobiales bacterium]
MTDSSAGEGASPPPTTPQRLDLPDADGLSGRLFPPLPTEAEWSLERLHTLLDELDRPHRAYPTVHVGGTNGKGSVAVVWASILKEAGHRVGLYTSPHLVRFAERFRVDGASVDDAELIEAASRIRDSVVRHGLTFFEASTVLAFRVFHRARVDVAVVEVGLGGRLDATNVVRPEVCAVTSVGLDHVEYLGETLEKVAAEKAGIAKVGVPFITAEEDPALVEVLRRVAASRGASFHHLDDIDAPGDGGPILLRKIGIEGSRFRLPTDSWGDLSLETPLVGRHQVRNVGLAVRALDLLTSPLRPDAESVVRGVREARWPGRFQVIREEGRFWILDVAHNPAGMGALVETAREIGLPGPRIAVFGCLGDKDWRSMLGLLEGWAEGIVLVAVPGAPPGRGWDPWAAREAFPDRCETTSDLLAALERGRERTASGGSVLVTGSHRLVGAAHARLDAGSSP